MKRYLPALALCLAVTLSACSSPAPGPDATDQSAPPTLSAPAATPSASAAPEHTPVTMSPTPSESAPADTPVTAPVWGQTEDIFLPEAEDGTILLQGSITVPRIKNDVDVPAFEAITAYYARIIQETREGWEDQLAWSQDDYAAAQSSGFPFTPPVAQYSYVLARQTDRYVSFSRELYANEGGAYPSTYRFAETFDLTTGRQLRFTDVFVSPDDSIAFIRKELLAQNATEPDIGIADSALDASFQPERFYLTDKGVVFFFQGEDLGPFHSPVEYTISYDKLEAYLAEWIRN